MENLTPVEWVIVFVILGLLAAIAIPSYKKAKLAAQPPSPEKEAKMITQLKPTRIGEFEGYIIYSIQDSHCSHYFVIPKTNSILERP